MRAVAEGRLPNDSTSFERHIDRCLGCRACESVCPAGVEYGQLFEAGRAELFGSKRKLGNSLLKLILDKIWLHPRRLKLAFALCRLLRDAGIARLLLKLGLPKLISKRLEFALALLESSSGRMGNAKPTATAKIPARQTQSSAMLFAGCVGEGLFSRVNDATERVLKVNGIATSRPKDQVCCGALHAHAGDLDGARKLARQNIGAFGDSNLSIVTNAGGCGAMLTTYHHLLADDETFRDRAKKFSSRVRDVSSLLEKDTVRGCASAGNRVSYDASCHLMYGQHAAGTSLEMLCSIPNLDFVPLQSPERCCGGAGIYNLLEPDLSERVLAEKLADIRQSGAEVVATGNPGCQMQIAAGALLSGMKVRVCHPIELLDESYDLPKSKNE
jgi:glycolate oxidase iron-sulfur subunit